MPQTTQADTQSSELPPHKAALLQACLSAKSLSFGTFTLKSGRISPYFFNSATLHNGSTLATLAHAAAITIATYDAGAQPNAVSGSVAQPLGFDFDVLFGPAYKGIPLATATTVALNALSSGAAGAQPQRSYAHVSYAFNRKTAKAYGDGGTIVGAPLAGKRVLVIDDVITAGTAIREAISIIEEQGGTLVGVVIALDRQEKTTAVEAGVQEQGLSAVGQIRRAVGVPVQAVLTLDDIVVGYRSIGSPEDIARLEAYREEYRAKD